MKLKDNPVLKKINATDYGACVDPILTEEILSVNKDADDAEKWLKTEYNKLKLSAKSRLDARDSLTKRILVKLTEAGYTDSQGYGLDECKTPNSVVYHKDRVSLKWDITPCQAGWISGVQIVANYKIFSIPSNQLLDMNRTGLLGHLVLYKEIDVRFT